MIKHEYIPKAIFESNALQWRDNFFTLNDINCNAIDPVLFLDFLTETHDLDGWDYASLNTESEVEILGKFNVNDNVIWVEERLQENIPRMTFTMLHEANHFFYHKKLFTPLLHNHLLFDKQYEFICKRGDIAGQPIGNETRKRLEWQANYGAACLLMPMCDIQQDIQAGASIRDIVERYKVSTQAAEIRYKEAVAFTYSNTLNEHLF
jgi:Zn-dependent peptidase ImmA (M78 family)